MTRLAQFLTTCSLLLLNPIALQAQDISVGDPDLDGQSIQLGETNLIPSLRIVFESTDNIFRSEENELDGDRVIVNPELFWSAERRLLALQAKYEGNYAIASEDALDFTDHRLSFSADAELSSKHRSSATAALELGHIGIGSGVLSNATEQDPNEVAEFTNIALAGSHTYGAFAAKGNVSGGLRLQSFDYRNQPLFTTGRSYLKIEPFAQFRYRVSADTRLLIGGRLSNFTFDNDNSDRLDTTVFTGLDFSATGKLSGIFRVGATQSTFSLSGREDETSLFLDSEVSYKPTSFSKLTLDLRREVDNNRGSLAALESAISTVATLDWRHAWSSRISTLAGIEWEQFDAVCPEPSDTVTTASFEIEFALRRWVSFGLNASQESRSVSSCANVVDDTNALADYDRAAFGAFIKGTL